MSRAFFISLFVSCAVSVMSKACTGTATYSLSFQGEWTANGRPPDAHFSGLVGCSHNHCYQMFKTGEKASIGVKNVAESGNSAELGKKIRKHADQDNSVILEYFESSQIGPESLVIVPRPTNVTRCGGFRVDGRHPLVSVIIGIVPSPDWFIGVEDLELCNVSSGEWHRKVDQTLLPYDAGTDSVRDINSSASVHQPTYPQERISRLRYIPSLYGDNNQNYQRGLGYFAFTRCEIFPLQRDSKTVGDYECGASLVKWSTLLILLSTMITVFIKPF